MEAKTVNESQVPLIVELFSQDKKHGWRKVAQSEEHAVKAPTKGSPTAKHGTLRNLQGRRGEA